MNERWHASTSLLEAYASDAVDETNAYSVEAHLMACGRCRRGLTAKVRDDRLDEIWEDVASTVDAPPAGLVERALVRLGISDHAARLLAATPSLRISWFGAIAVALTFAVVAAHAGPNGGLAFLVVAPLVPLAGVAASYGPRMDPTYEVGLAAPMRSLRLLLIRTVAVVTTSIALAGVASLALPELDWMAAAWLLPAFALTALSLAMSTVSSPGWSFGGVAFSWITVSVLGEFASGTRLPLFRAGGQAAFLVLALVGLAVLAARRESLEVRRGT